MKHDYATNTGLTAH